MLKAIVILSGGIKKDKNGRWHSTDLSEEDNRWGAPGGYLRVLAAKHLFDVEPGCIIVATGGQGYDVAVKDEQQPLICEIIKSELADLEVVKEKIILEKKSNHTIDQVKALEQIIKKNKFDEIVVISSRYHLSRVQAIMKREKALSVFLEQGKIKLRSAEEILIKSNKNKWQGIVEQAYNSQWMSQRVAEEIKGVSDFRAGKYKIKNKK